MESPIRHTLPKKERLCGNTGISSLLSYGKFGNVPGIRYCWKANNGLEYDRVLFSVPKKVFKRAVKRNLLKRRMREGWRLQKHLHIEKGCDILLTYSTKEILSFEEISTTIREIIEKINKTTAQKNGKEQ